MSKTRLDIRRADDTSALLDFRCGVKSMDNFIHNQENGLAKFIKYGLSNLWLVYEGNKVVAFFALSKDALVLNSDDIRTICRDGKKAVTLPEQDDDKFWEREKFPAIEIDYLAVCKEKREEPDEHLGLDTEKYSAVEFYRSCGFETSEKGRIQNYNRIRNGEQPTTQRMYKIIIPIDT
ncbi:MAG: N-acetyltransferase [Prevotella sp.]|nr:N-acetyltransferase [Prevotella sp.]